MMSRNLFTEKDVLNALNIDSFRNLSKDKLMEFISLIPEMDKDVAMSIINQFPEFATMGKEMIDLLSGMCKEALEANNKSQEDAIKAYRNILNDLGEMLKRPDVSREERDTIVEKMILVADRISAKDTENKQFISGLVRNNASVVVGALLLGAVVLGTRVTGTSIPRITR